MDKKELAKAGLSLSEAEAYLCLLEHGPCLASRIASSTRISRPHVYSALDSLIKKGLASFFIRENRRYFSAAEPEKFLSLLKERERALEEDRTHVERLVPELKKIRKKPEEEVMVEVFRGIEGFKTVMEDVLKEGRGQRTIGYTGKGLDLAPLWWEKWQKRRIERKIKRQLITTGDMRGHEDIVRPLTEARFLPVSYILPTSIMLYGKEKILLYIPFEKDFVGIRIKSAKLRTSYESYFDLLWRFAKK